MVVLYVYAIMALIHIAKIEVKFAKHKKHVRVMSLAFLVITFNVDLVWKKWIEYNRQF